MMNTARTCAVVTPMSRTRPALRGEQRPTPRSGRPNSLTSIAPATLNRSVIVEPISALSCMLSRVSRCSRRPSRRAGRRNSGIRTSAIR